MSVAVKVNRTMTVSEFARERIRELFNEWRECKGCAMAGDPSSVCYSRPGWGKAGKFMVITDSPNWAEDSAGEVAAPSPMFANVEAAMKEAGLSKKDGYYTTLVKAMKPSSQKFLDENDIAKCSAQWLRREIEILKPPVIVALGSAIARYFIKDLKGGVTEHVGRSVYLPDIDATVVIGIAPGAVAYDVSKQKDLIEVFKTVAELVA